MKTVLPLLFTLLIAACALGQHAKRDTLEQTDTSRTHPLQGLRALDLTTEEDVFTTLGQAKKPRPNQYYFRVEGEEEYTRVGYAGTNLAQYVEPVDDAHAMMESYMYMRMGHVTLFYGGIALALAGTALSVSNSEFSPVLLGGVAVFSVSWVPFFMSHDKVPDAVGAYNAKIAEYKEKTGQ